MVAKHGDPGNVVFPLNLLIKLELNGRRLCYSNSPSLKACCRHGGQGQSACLTQRQAEFSSFFFFIRVSIHGCSYSCGQKVHQSILFPYENCNSLHFFWPVITLEIYILYINIFCIYFSYHQMTPLAETLTTLIT